VVQISYLTKRGAVYYARMDVPEDLVPILKIQTRKQSLKMKDEAEAMVVFRSKRGDRIKVLFWDGSGIVMNYERLEQGGFAWPKVGDGVMRLSRVQFEALRRSMRSARARDGAAAEARSDVGSAFSEGRGTGQLRPRPDARAADGSVGGETRADAGGRRSLTAPSCRKARASAFTRGKGKTR
jgi:transposase